MPPSACCARWSSPARSAGARARPQAPPPVWRCPPSSAPGRRAASTPSTPASPCCTLLYLKSEQFPIALAVSQVLQAGILTTNLPVHDHPRLAHQHTAGSTTYGPLPHRPHRVVERV